MSDSDNAGFSKFVPGFDFLQNLVKGASQTAPQMPNLASWIAPTLNVEELEKRINELKTVHFWLDQNSKALGATVQALEVQKMTLATLKGMNFIIGDMANALKPVDPKTSGVQRAPEKKAAPAKTITEMAAEAEAATAQKARDAARPAATPTSTTPAVPVPGRVDPMQLWGALTQQFQQIAASAMKDVGASAAIVSTKNARADFVKETGPAAKETAANGVKSSTSAKTAAKKVAGTDAKTPVKTAGKKVVKKVPGRKA